MDATVTTARVLVSLAVVLALVWVLARAARRSGVGGAAGTGQVAVIGRQALGRGAGVAVLRVGDQALVLGVTEHSVRLLTSTALADVARADVARADIARADVAPLPGGRAAVAVAPRAALPVAALPAAAPSRSELRRSASSRSTPSRSALAGSALSPATWARAVEVLRERTTRR